MTAVLDRSKLLFETPEWDFSMLDRVYDACQDIALNDLKLDIYPNQIEIIASEQMLDAYSSHGLPLMYSHWSFGKHFARDEAASGQPVCGDGGAGLRAKRHARKLGIVAATIEGQTNRPTRTNTARVVDIGDRRKRCARLRGRCAGAC